MKLLFAFFVASAFCWATAVGDPIDRVARQAAKPASCPTTKVRKKLTWNFYLPPIRQVIRYPQYYDLVSYGRGYTWREANGPDTADHITRRIMFENDQGWTVVNCTWKFSAGDPDRNGCTSPDFALLNTPGTNVGDAPPDKGRIGTLDALTYPALSPWAVYDLLEFRLTPVVTGKFLGEQVTVEVFGWAEDGTATSTMRFKIKGSSVGYKVSVPKGWNSIIQWQVRVWWSAGSSATRQDFPFLIDDVIIDEYAVSFTDTDTHCLFPTQTPGPASPAVTLKFDDIAASPTAALPTPYKSYTFVSDWLVTRSQSYSSNTPGFRSATSKPNSLYSSGLAITKFYGQDFLFDIDTFQITIDNTAASTQIPADLTLSVQSFGACYDTVSGAGTAAPGSYMTMIPTSYSFSVDLKALGFRKARGVQVIVYDTVGAKWLPFWLDDVVVRSWKDGLKGLPGCERCGGGTLTQPWGLRDFCEYPVQQR